MVEWWLHTIEDHMHWSQSCDLSLNVPEEEQNEVYPHTSLFIKTPLIPIDGYSSFDHLKRITTWIFWFVWNSLPSRRNDRLTSHLSSPDYQLAETYWSLLSQYEIFGEEIQILKKQRRYLNVVCRYPTSLPWLAASGFRTHSCWTNITINVTNLYL